MFFLDLPQKCPSESVSSPISSGVLSLDRLPHVQEREIISLNHFGVGRHGSVLPYLLHCSWQFTLTRGDQPSRTEVCITHTLFASLTLSLTHTHTHTHTLCLSLSLFPFVPNSVSPPLSLYPPCRRRVYEWACGWWHPVSRVPRAKGVLSLIRSGHMCACVSSMPAAQAPARRH